MTALSVRWVRRLVVLVGVVVCGVGCGGSGPEVAAIPSVVPADSESWVCPGVPAKSVMLVTGDDPVVSAASDPDYGWWACSASTTTLDQGLGSLVIVRWGLIDEGSSYKYMGDESARVRFPENVWTLPGVEGSGSWASNGSDSDSTAQWVCGDRYVEAYVAVDKGQKRDSIADARNLLTSVLPWACGDRPVPGATTTPAPTATTEPAPAPATAREGDG